MEIADFEAKNRELAFAVFSTGKVDDLASDQASMLGYCLSSGMYGTREHRVRNRVKESGILGYILRRAFFPIDMIRDYYPVFYKHRILLPFLPLYRLIRKWENAKTEIKTLTKC